MDHRIVAKVQRLWEIVGGLSEGRAQVKGPVDPEYKRTRGRKPGHGMKKGPLPMIQDLQRKARAEKSAWRKRTVSGEEDPMLHHHASKDGRAGAAARHKVRSLERSKAPKQAVDKARNDAEVKSRIADFTIKMRNTYDDVQDQAYHRKMGKQAAARARRSAAKRAASLAKMDADRKARFDQMTAGVPDEHKDQVRRALERMHLSGLHPGRRTAEYDARVKADRALDRSDRLRNQPRAKLDTKPGFASKQQYDKAWAERPRPPKLESTGTRRYSRVQY